MNQRDCQIEQHEEKEAEWLPSVAATRSSVFALGIGVGLILATTPVLAQGIGGTPTAGNPLHLEAVQLVGFLAILACMPAVLLVCASAVRILLLLTRTNTGARRETNVLASERTWKRSETNPALPALHLALPARLSEDIASDSPMTASSWSSLTTESSFPRFPSV